MAENKLAQKQTGLVAVTEEGLCTRPVERPAITEHEVEQLQRANASNLQPIVFVHGLWLLPSSWDRWATLFEEAGYTALSPGWPDDPETVEEANANPEILAHKTIGQVAEHCEQIICRLNRKPAIIGHSFGGLLVQILAGRGLSAATVAIDPAPFRGVLPLPLSSLKSAWPVLGNPANRNRAIPLTFDQFRFGDAQDAHWSPPNDAGRRYHSAFDSLVVLLTGAIVTLTALSLAALRRRPRAQALSARSSGPPTAAPAPIPASPSRRPRE